jgi:hypothetical protein
MYKLSVAEIHSDLDQKSREQYLSAKNKALQHICKINGIDYSYTAYIKDTDY